MWSGCLFVVKGLWFVAKHLILILWYLLVLIVKLVFWITVGFLVGAFMPRKIKQ